MLYQVAEADRLRIDGVQVDAIVDEVDHIIYLRRTADRAALLRDVHHAAERRGMTPLVIRGGAV